MKHKETALNATQTEICKALSDMGLQGMAEGYCNQLDFEESYKGMDFDSRLQELIRVEEEFRQNKTYTRLRLAAALPDFVPMTKIIAEPSRGLSPNLIQQLRSLKWFEALNNIVVSGATGVGKTALLTAIALELCRNGIRVRYYNTRDLLDEFRYKDPSKERPNMRKRLKTFKALILDDFGITDLNGQDIEFLMKIAEDRYGKGVLILGSQLQIGGILKAITQAGGNSKSAGAVADAFIDRLTKPMLKIELQGDSMRGKTENVISAKLKESGIEDKA